MILMKVRNKTKMHYHHFHIILEIQKSLFSQKAATCRNIRVQGFELQLFSENIIYNWKNKELQLKLYYK